MNMKKNLMLFKWFIKFGAISSRDEYNIHDYIRNNFCPEYIPQEEFDEREQVLRDTPGPAGIKYAYYVGSKVNGIAGAVIAIISLLIPIIAISIVLYFVYKKLFIDDSGMAGVFASNIVRGIHAATLGLIAAHLYKIVYFNRVNKKSLIIIVPAALVFIFLPDIIHINNAVLMPFYILAIIVLGIIFGFIHDKAVKYNKNKPVKYIDPYSRKAKKMHDRLIREEEEELRKYTDNDPITLRKQQLEEEEKNRKHKGEE